MKRILLLSAATLFCAAATAQTAQQTQTTTVPAVEVERLAPQLVAFAGGDINFSNLVNGLALGLPVTLSTPLTTGGAQLVTFTPAGRLTTTQIAQTLEAARQSLIAQGIATPTATQLGAVLAGGALTTPTGTTQMPGLVGTTTALNTNNVNATAAAGGGTAVSPAVALQQQRSANIAGTSRTNTSDSPFPRGVADTPPLPVPGVTTGPAPAATAPGAATAPPAAHPEGAPPAAAGRIGG
jgi:hypothetical protein